MPSEIIFGSPVLPTSRQRRIVWLSILFGGLILLLGVLAAGGFTSHGDLTTVTSGKSQASAVVDIGVLVFREGLECILVLAAITASMRGNEQRYQSPVSAGVGVAIAATLLTWSFAVRVIDDIGRNVSALAIQAATGLLAIVVLLVVMNWFFHRVYWTGWISLHNQRKRDLLRNTVNDDRKLGLMIGMGLLGFTSFYREGFEVVLFLQSYRLRLGGSVILQGVGLGVLGSGIVAILTFVAHRRLPYRKMLVATGMMLAFVLLVMVGEEAQEMQFARWLPTTEIPWLACVIPSWIGLWLSVSPSVETLSAQALAALLVFGSYLAAQPFSRWNSHGQLDSSRRSSTESP